MIKLRESRGPGFLGIGAARAGTTWLYANLRNHPQLWLSPVKELHYWDIQRPNAAQHYPLKQPSITKLRLYWRWMHLQELVRAWRKGDTSLGWAWRYYCGIRSDAWYASLFPADRLAGEITPGYMLLPPAVIEAMQQMNPDLKAILLLRNPVVRAWSNACHFLRGRGDRATLDDYRRFALSPHGLLRGDYVRTIHDWRAVLGPDRLFVGFYDDLHADPRRLLRSILQFLEVDSGDEHLPERLDKKVNASKSLEMPVDVQRELSANYLPQLRELETMFGGCTSQWRAEAEEAVRN